MYALRARSEVVTPGVGAAVGPRAGPGALPVRRGHSLAAGPLGEDLTGELDAVGADPHTRAGDHAGPAGRVPAAERALLGGRLPPAPSPTLPFRAQITLEFLLDGGNAGAHVPEHPPGP